MDFDCERIENDLWLCEIGMGRCLLSKEIALYLQKIHFESSGIGCRLGSSRCI